MRLAEKYRPRSLDSVIGQPKACAAIARLFATKSVGGRAFWFSGASATGKTTLARILADSIADGFFTTEIVGREVTKGTLDRIESEFGLSAWGKGGRAWIINEAHGLSKQSIERLLDVLESIPAHCVVIFTTTRDGQEALFEDQIDAVPLLSRCIPFRLTNQGLADAAAPMLQQIAQTEGLDGQPVAAYKRLMQRCGNNIRAAIQRIEAGEMLVGGEA
jgi:replication-associated recombination protein RarA